MSSYKTITTLYPCQDLSHHSLKNLGPEVMPNGNLRHRKRSNGVIKIVSNELLLFKGVCQNLDSASRVVNHLAPCILVKISSTTGIVNCSRLIDFVELTEVNTHFYMTILLENWHHGCNSICRFNHFLNNSHLLYSSKSIF